jgi:hypothetical protein
MGVLYLLRGHIEEALTHLRRSRDADAREPETHMKLGSVLFRLGLLANAELVEKIKAAEDQKFWGLKLPAGEIGLDWDRIIGRSRDVAGKLNKGIEFLFKKNKITHIVGNAKIVKAENLMTAPPGGKTKVTVSGSVCDRLPENSVFESLSVASVFFRAGSLGYSATQAPGRFDGMELCCHRWNVESMQIDNIESSFFGDQSRFPAGTIEFDCALLMRQIEHEWRGREDLCC